jgi:thiosulfate/3-mercaptopyruvate sulfurtransferase
MVNRSGPLITAEGLAELISQSVPAPTILDVRWDLSGGADRAAYRRGHVPGAVFVDLDAQLADPPSERGRHPLPSAERFTAEMRSAGVSESRTVVVYDAAASTAAARAWWLLRYFGHARVLVLDGGFAAWVAGGHPVTTEPTSVPRGSFVARPGGMPVLALDEVERAVAAGVLIDARAPERFRGLTEPIDPVAGHIPGARNRPTSENVNADGRFLEGSALRAAFAGLGIREGVPVAAYCGSGITAAHEVLALELAGYHAALYPGSWSEWIADPRRPVARQGAAGAS